jgi:hypothetical protein
MFANGDKLFFCEFIHKNPGLFILDQRHNLRLLCLCDRSRIFLRLRIHVSPGKVLAQELEFLPVAVDRGRVKTRLLIVHPAFVLWEAVQGLH